MVKSIDRLNSRDTFALAMQEIMKIACVAGAGGPTLVAKLLGFFVWRPVGYVGVRQSNMTIFDHVPHPVLLHGGGVLL